MRHRFCFGNEVKNIEVETKWPSFFFLPKGPINNIPALVQIMAWCRPGNEPSSEPISVIFTDAFMRHSVSISYLTLAVLNVSQKLYNSTFPIESLLVVRKEPFILHDQWLLMIWQRKEPRHQQPWWWPSCPEYSSFSTGSMMMSSNRNIFRLTGHLRGEFTGHRWIPRTKASDAEFDVFFDLRLNQRLSKHSWGCWFERQSRPLWRRCNGVSTLTHRGRDFEPI